MGNFSKVAKKQLKIMDGARFHSKTYDGTIIVKGSKLDVPRQYYLKKLQSSHEVNTLWFEYMLT